MFLNFIFQLILWKIFWRFFLQGMLFAIFTSPYFPHEAQLSQIIY